MKWYEYLVIGIAMVGAIHLGLLIRADAVQNVPDNMAQVRAEQAKAKEIQPPVATNDRVTIELIATMEDGKVRVYRLMDYNAGLIARTCHITVGELHGKTVTMDCD